MSAAPGNHRERARGYRDWPRLRLRLESGGGDWLRTPGLGKRTGGGAARGGTCAAPGYPVMAKNNAVQRPPSPPGVVEAALGRSDFLSCIFLGESLRLFDRTSQTPEKPEASFAPASVFLLCRMPAIYYSRNMENLHCAWHCSRRQA